MRPHLELSVDFGGADPAQRGEAKLAVRNHAPDVSIVASPSASRMVLSAGGARLILSAHDLVGGNAPNANFAQIRLMVHDESDAVFEELDQNADGRLGEREIAVASTQLLARDGNGDGQLAAGELRYSMVVALLRGEAEQEQSFYVPTFATPANAAQAPSWFAKADFNGDGDISRREFLGSFERFDAVDDNRDGYINRDEAAAFDEKPRKEKESDG
jgi:hypothetical protein